MITRRALLAAAALNSCGPRLARRFNGYALVANRGSRSVAAVNLTRFKTEKSIAVGGPPEAVLPFARRHSALVLVPEAGTACEITAGSLRISRKAHFAGMPAAARLVDAEKMAWILLREPAALVPLPLDTWQPGPAVRLGALVRSFDVASDGRIAVVSYAGRKQCALIHTSTGAVRTLDVPAEAGIVRFRPDGKQVLIASEAARSVTIADLNGRVIAILPMPFAPRNFCFSEDNGGQMFVTGPGMDSVGIIYPYQAELGETILAGRAPDTMAVNGTMLFVANPPAGDVTVFSIAERQLLAKIESGKEPETIVFTPDGEYVLVLNRGSGDLAAIRLSKLTDLRYKRAPLFTVVAVGEDPVAAAVIEL